MDKGEMTIDGTHTITLALKSLYNIYNILSAYTVASIVGVDGAKIAADMNHYVLKNIIVDAVSRKYFTSDVSWLYDIDFEMLGSDNIHQIVLAGKYVNDLAVRFSYTDIPSERIKLFESIDEAADYLNSDRSEYIYVITCFSDKGKFLVKVKED